MPRRKENMIVFLLYKKRIRVYFPLIKSVGFGRIMYIMRRRLGILKRFTCGLSIALCQYFVVIIFIVIPEKIKVLKIKINSRIFDITLSENSPG